MIRARALAAIAAAMLFAGCAALAPQADIPVAAPFDVLGRMLASGDGRAFSSNVRWRHGVEDEEIWLMSPVGQTLAHIVADSSGATLTAADSQVYSARTVEGLTENALGWALPLTRLQHWIRGSIVPGGVIAAVDRDAHGRLSVLGQDGWTVRYTYGVDTVGGPQLPRRIDLVRGGQQIRLVIDDWRVGDAR